jgi:hypothetical protein
MSSVEDAGTRACTPRLALQLMLVPSAGMKKETPVTPLVRVWLVLTGPQLAAEAIDGIAKAARAMIEAKSMVLLVIVFFIVLLLCVSTAWSRENW